MICVKKKYQIVGVLLPLVLISAVNYSV